MTKSVLLFIAFMGWYAGAIAQLDTDSLSLVWRNESLPDSSRFKAIDDHCYTLAFSQPDSALRLCDFQTELAQLKTNNSEHAKALNNKAMAWYVKSDLDQSMACLNEALEIVKTLNDTLALSRQYNNIGNIARDKGDFREGVRLYRLSLGLAQEMGHTFYEAGMLNNIGLIYEDIDEHLLALDYFNQAKALYSELEIVEKTGNIWLNIGSVNLELGHDVLALEQAKKARSILSESNQLLALVDCDYVIANIYTQTGNRDSALHYIDESIRVSEQLGSISNFHASRLLKATILFDEDPEYAKRVAENALEELESTDVRSLRRQLRIYDLLALCYEQKGDFEKAFEMKEQYIFVSDSLKKEDVRVALVRSAIQKDFDEQLFGTRLENEKAQAALKLQQLRRTYAILLTCFVLVMAIGFYTRRRILRHRQKEERLLKELDELKNKAALAASENGTFQLNRTKLEDHISKQLNETDWEVLNVLFDDPVSSNKEIAEKVFKSVDGVGSSLRRMYVLFEIKESKYKKISLITSAIKISNS